MEKAGKYLEKPVIPLGNMLTSVEKWLTCGVCGEEFSKLTDGKCMDCLRQQQNAQAEKTKEEEKAIEMLGLKGYHRFTFENYRQTARNKAGFEACKAFNHEKDSFYIYGPVGCGKSHLAWAIVRNVRGGQVYKATELIRWFRMRDPREEEREIERLAKVPCLVIDDLGVQKDSEHSLGVLYEVLDKRDMDMRNGLVITSNLPLDDLARKMGDDRITSRIAGMCKTVKLDGNDGRLDAVKSLQ